MCDFYTFVPRPYQHCKDRKNDEDEGEDYRVEAFEQVEVNDKAPDGSN